MDDDSLRATVTDRFEVVVGSLQSVLAALLVVLFALGVLDVVLLIVTPFLSGNITNEGEIIGLIVSSIDTILYLLIVVELYHTVIAYVEERAVVRAVVHAGLIAVARKIITFEPGGFDSATDLILSAGAYALLLVVLLAGYYIVHRIE